jgi:Zn-dependent protease
MPFRCQYCGGYFCSQHRLPESHACPQIAQARVPKEQERPAVVQTKGSTGYTYETFIQTPKQFRFSNKELEHLAVAAALVVAVGLSLEFQASQTWFWLALSAVAFTASFLAHEIAHKIIAQKHGLWAEFRLTSIGAILTALSTLLPLKLISPGAVMIAGTADQRTIGRTAMAGPATNIILAAVFSATSLAQQASTLSLATIAWFNAWIAAFNLIPFGIFDGLKVYRWDKRVWTASFAIGLTLTVGLALIFRGTLI